MFVCVAVKVADILLLSLEDHKKKYLAIAQSLSLLLITTAFFVDQSSDKSVGRIGNFSTTMSNTYGYSSTDGK
jgi:hypothetical protein